MLSRLTRTFFNTWYRFFPPAMATHWKHRDASKAKVVTREDGSFGMKIEGEEKVYPGFPRAHILTGPLAALKHKVKNMVFNQVFAELEKMASEHKHDMVPPERMPLAVRHIHETFDKLVECEVVPDMKARMKLIQKVLTWFLVEDDAYRFRAQLFLELIEQKKVKLSEEDLFYARAKYWRPDRYIKIFGKVLDKHTY